MAEVLFRQESKFAVKCQFKAPVMTMLFYSKSKDVFKRSEKAGKKNQRANVQIF